jgi:hypothetical protein
MKTFSIANCQWPGCLRENPLAFQLAIGSWKLAIKK